MWATKTVLTHVCHRRLCWLIVPQETVLAHKDYRRLCWLIVPQETLLALEAHTRVCWLMPAARDSKLIVMATGDWLL